jgi:hypothetical protein
VKPFETGDVEDEARGTADAHDGVDGLVWGNEDHVYRSLEVPRRKQENDARDLEQGQGFRVSVVKFSRQTQKKEEQETTHAHKARVGKNLPQTLPMENFVCASVCVVGGRS